MKKLIAISIFISCLSTLVIGQSKEDDLKKLFDAMQSEKMIDKMMLNMLPALKQQAEQYFQDEETKDAYDEYIEFVLEKTTELSKKLVNVEMIKIYDRHFTHEEIKDLIIFYESPVGKKMLEKTPEITKDLMDAMMNEYMPEFQEELLQKLEGK